MEEILGHLGSVTLLEGRAAREVALAGALLLVLAACWLRVRRKGKIRRAALTARLGALASQLAKTGEQIAADAPMAKAALKALSTLTQSRTGSKLREQEVLIDDLQNRARVLAAAAKALLSRPPALERCSVAALEEKLRFLMAANKRMQGIRDGFDARLAVLQSSEQAMRRSRA